MRRITLQFLPHSKSLTRPPPPFNVARMWRKFMESRYFFFFVFVFGGGGGGGGRKGANRLT